MSDPKQKKQLKVLGGLVVLMLLVIYWNFGGGAPRTPTGSEGRLSSDAPELKDFVLRTRQRRGKAGNKAIPVSEINSTIHFEKLGQMKTVEPSVKRNMFAFYTPSVPKKTDGGDRASPQTQVLSRPPVVSQSNSVSSVGHHSVSINLKFYGFKNNEDGSQRQGFFADGDTVFLAWEGDLVSNRYRIHRITDTRAEVEEVSSKTRVQLVLVSPEGN